MKKILKNLSKNTVALLAIVAIMGVSSVPTEATTILEGTSPSLIEAGVGNGNAKIDNGIANNNSIIQGGGTLSKAESYVDDKLGDVVGFFQSAIKPFTYVMFIISAIFILLGIVTGSKNKFYGLLGMAFSVIVYVAVMYAPQLVDYFSAWLSV